MIYLLQVAGLVGLLRYRLAKADDQRFLCGMAVALAVTVSLLFWGSW